MARKKLSAKKCKLTFMRTLSRLTPQELRDLFRRLSAEAIDDISEIVFNSIYSNFDIDQRSVKKLQSALASNEANLRFIADRSNSTEARRRRLLQQKGSGLGILLGTLVPAIASLIASQT